MISLYRIFISSRIRHTRWPRDWSSRRVLFRSALEFMVRSVMVIGVLMSMVVVVGGPQRFEVDLVSDRQQSRLRAAAAEQGQIGRESRRGRRVASEGGKTRDYTELVM